MRAQFFGQVGDFLKNELLFQESLLLVVKSFLKDMNLGKKSLLVRILSWQINCVRVVGRVFKLLGQALHFRLLVIQLFIYADDLLSELRHFRNLLAHHRVLTLAFLELEVNHTDCLLFLTDFLLSILEDVLLNV